MKHTMANQPGGASDARADGRCQRCQHCPRCFYTDNKHLLDNSSSYQSSGESEGHSHKRKLEDFSAAPRAKRANRKPTRACGAKSDLFASLVLATKLLDKSRDLAVQLSDDYIVRDQLDKAAKGVWTIPGDEDALLIAGDGWKDWANFYWDSDGMWYYDYTSELWWWVRSYDAVLVGRSW